MSDWIKVEDKFPDFNTAVIAIDTNKKIAILKLSAIRGTETANGSRVDSDWYEKSSLEEYYGEITHWMPLPEPPKN